MVLLNELGGDKPILELGVSGQVAEEVDVGVQPTNVVLGEGSVQLRKRRSTIRSPDYQLGDHGVVVHGHGIALLDASFNAEVRGWGRRAQVLQRAGAGNEVLGRILGVDASLESMSALLDLLLRHRQRESRRSQKLPFNKIGVRHHLRHWMLNLKASVHLHEVVLVRFRVHQELHSSGTNVVHRLGCSHGRPAEMLSQLFIQVRSGALLDDLLVTALDAAVTLVQVNGVAEGVCEDLHLDVTGTLDVLLDEDASVSKGAFGLLARALQVAKKVCSRPHNPHSLATAPKHWPNQTHRPDHISMK
eukprot:m.828564 g.828564  ORF g.828564 m.828564 type:complete len:303 (-) comp59439_c0_seq1:167-1075(-)